MHGEKSLTDFYHSDGKDGVSAIFGSTSADGAKKLHCSGFNHVPTLERA